MKFLVDECAGASVVDCLRKAGHDVVAVAEVMPRQMTSRFWSTRFLQIESW